MQQYITDCIAKPEYDFDSDHCILITYLQTPMTRRARWRKKEKRKQRRPDENSLQNSETRKNFINVVSKHLQNNFERLESPTEISTKIVKTLEISAQSTLPTKTSNKQVKEIWKDDNELNKLLDQRQSIDKSDAEYKNLTKKIKTRVNSLRNDKLQQEAEEINEHANRRQVEELYRSMKSDGASFQNIQYKHQCDPAKLKEYFFKHFNQSAKLNEPIELTAAPIFVKKLQDIPEDLININPPEKSELLATIKSLKNKRSANDIPITYLKTLVENDEFMNEMVILYKMTWETKMVPKNWGHFKLVKIWKGLSKGSIDDPKAYRPLQVGSSLCKIMTAIITNRLKNWYQNQLLDQQQGFRPGRGTTDGIFTTKIIHQITDKMKKPVYVLFVDLTAAFDHIERDWLIKVIKQRLPENVDNTLIQLIEALYSYTTTALVEAPEDVFELTLGVRQGGPESPMLFNLYIDYIIRVFLDICKTKNIKFLELKFKIPERASDNERIVTGSNMQDWSGYADDLCFMLEDKKSLEILLELLNKTFYNFSLEKKPKQ